MLYEKGSSSIVRKVEALKRALWFFLIGFFLGVIFFMQYNTVDYVIDNKAKVEQK